MIELHVIAVNGSDWLGRSRERGGYDFRRQTAGWEKLTAPAFGEIACASGAGGVLHLVDLSNYPPPGSLMETARHLPSLYESGAGWELHRYTQPASDPDIRPLRHVAAAATVDGNLHIVTAAYSGAAWYTTKFADDTWEPAWLGDFPSPNIRPVTDVACATSPNGDLFVCALTRKGTLHYAIRSAAGIWSDRWLADFPAPDIRPIAHPSDVDLFFGLPVRPIACAVAPSGEFHVCVIANAGDLYHAVRGHRIRILWMTQTPVSCGTRRTSPASSA